MDQDSFDFISNQKVKSNIINSIDFSSTLWLLSEKIPEKNREESYRTIILYTASIIEALLLYYFSEKKLSFEEEKFTHVARLGSQFQNNLGEVVVAIRKSEERKDPDFFNCINYLEKTLGKNLSKSIHKIRDTRNTFHLLKTRKKIKENDIKYANEILLKLVKKIQTKLEFKK